MTRTKSTYLALVAVLLSPMAANADLIQIDALSLDARFTDFSVIYDDVSGDGLLQFDELVSFSGFTLSGTGAGVDGLYDLLIGTAQVDGISAFTGTAVNTATSNWHFVREDGLTNVCCSRSFWSYSKSAVSVPEPGTLALLGIGLLGMGAARRRKKA